MNPPSKEPNHDTRRRILCSILHMLGKSMPPAGSAFLLPEFLDVPPVPEPAPMDCHQKFLVQVAFPTEGLTCQCALCRQFVREHLQSILHELLTGYLHSENPLALKSGTPIEISVTREP